MKKVHHIKLPVVPVLTACMLLLSACSSAPVLQPTPAAEEIVQFSAPQTFSSRPALPTPQDLHYLTPEQEAAFLNYLNSPNNFAVSRHRRVYNYLARITEKFNYQSNTYTASQALTHMGGNCLSLALLTTALAQLAGIEIDYQLLDDEPVFEYLGTLVEKGVHVRTILYDQEWVPDGPGFGLISRPGLKIDYFPSNRERFIGNLSYEEYLGMYYRNKAVDALSREDYDFAYWYAIESMEYAPDHSEALNLLAVTNRRAGDIAKAEEIYLYGIAHAEEKLSLLKNYRVLLTLEGRLADADEIDNQLSNIYDPSPFNWFQLARAANNDGDYFRAIRYYNKALQLAPYLHEAHLGIAQARYELGQLAGAESALEQAVAEASKVSTRKLYKAKLYSLRQQNLN